MSQESLTGRAHLLRRVSTVDRITVTVDPNETLRARGIQTVPTTCEMALPAQFNEGARWRVAHASPSTGEVVTWDWVGWDEKPKTSFNESCSLSSYYMRDASLLDDIAGVFSRLVLHRIAQGVDVDCRLVPQ